jgi:hypothetical protein
MTAEDVLPALSVATAVMSLLPTASVTLQVNVPPVTDAATLLQVTLARWDVASLTVPLMDNVELVTVVPLAGELMASKGGVASSVRWRVAVFVFPEVSVAMAVIVFGPSPPVRVTDVVHAPLDRVTGVSFTVTLDTATSSVAVPLTVIVASFVSELSAGEVMVMTGACESGLYVTVRDAVAVLPAASVAIVVMVLGPGLSVAPQENVPPLIAAKPPLQVTPATPERLSLTVPVTVSDDEVTVAPLAGEVMATSGAWVSSFTTTEAAF